MSEITGNISLKKKDSVNIAEELGNNNLGKIYLPNGKELEIKKEFEDYYRLGRSNYGYSDFHIYNCNGVLVLEITYTMKPGDPPYMKETIVGNFVLLSRKGIKIEDCNKKEEKKNE